MVEEFLETLNLSSPENSSEDESSDESEGEEASPGPSVKKVHETPESRKKQGHRNSLKILVMKR